MNESEVEQLKRLFVVEFQGLNEVVECLKNGKEANWFSTTTFKIVVSAEVPHLVLEKQMGFMRDDILAEGYVKFDDKTVSVSSLLGKHKIPDGNIYIAIKEKIIEAINSIKSND